MKHTNVNSKAAFCAAALSAVIAIIFLIYGLVNSYFDLVILICQLGAAACFALCALKSSGWTEYLGLAAVMLLSYATGLFFLNSYTVWADWYGNFNMYGSRGGIAPVIVQLALLFAAIILGIVSCFQSKGGKNL